MRTLSRPMFNWGGPVKEGIMHGIREPKKHGGKMLLVGQHPKEFQDKSGREKHVAPVVVAGAVGLNALRHGAMRYGARYLPRIWQGAKNIFGKNVAQNVGTTNVGGKVVQTVGSGTKFVPNWLGRDPVVRGVGWAGKSIFNPTVGGWAAKGLRMATSPSSIIAGVAYYMWPDGEERRTPPPGSGRETGVPGGGDPGMYYEAPPKKLSEAERKAFALKQRTERVDKYMEMMGYDRSKKTAIADALIDASKIVGDRGTLDLKNIGRDLINPIIQATSKRLDKPEQIREAVGLMATKAEIEKDLSAETDALDKEYKRTQIAVGKKSLERGFEKDMADFFLGSRTKPDKKQTETYARIKADEYGLPFTKVTNEEIAKAPEGASEAEIIQSVVGEDGIYMVGNAMIKVTDGVPKVLIGA